MSYKYLSLSFFKFVLKLHLQKLQHTHIRPKTARQKWLPNCQRLNVRKGRQISGFLLGILFQMHASCTACRPPAGLVRWVSRALALAVPKPARKDWIEHGFVSSPQCSGFGTNIWTWNYFIRVFLKTRKTFIPIFHFFSKFLKGGSCCTADLVENRPWYKYVTAKKTLSSRALNTHADYGSWNRKVKQ